MIEVDVERKVTIVLDGEDVDFIVVACDEATRTDLPLAHREFFALLRDAVEGQM